MRSMVSQAIWAAKRSTFRSPEGVPGIAWGESANPRSNGHGAVSRPRRAATPGVRGPSWGSRTHPRLSLGRPPGYNVLRTTPEGCTISGMTATRADAPLTCLLTGCASGIGRHLADRLLERGARVCATDVAEDALRSHADEASWPGERLLLDRLDVTDPQDWQRLVDRAATAWGRLDVVMNVAGFLRPGEIHEAVDEDVHRHFDVNVKGVVFGTRAAARHMIPNRRGHIVNVASMASLAPIPGIALYSASKYAVRAFSLAAAEELRPHGIAVTTVCPDAVRTPMLDLQLDYEQAALTFTAPRLLAVEDIGRLVLGRVLEKRPLLVAIPRRRAWLARFADLFPSTTRWIAARLQKQGLERQKELRALRERAER